MKRKDFIKFSALGASSLLLPNFMLNAASVDTSVFLNDGMDIKLKKQLADIALQTAKSKGASYADVRINRYLTQTISTREARVDNIANTESFGAGVRVIVNGAWGFAASNDVTKESIIKTAERAVAIAKANAKIATEPVQLAPQKGYGEVSWKTPIEKNAFEIPIKEKVDLLLSVNNEGLKNGGSFFNSQLFFINEQKYFASTDGSYIDQDVHRLWPTFTITKIDRAAGKFETRNSLSAPMGMGYEYLIPQEKEKLNYGSVTVYKNRYDMLEDARFAVQQVAEKLKAKPIEPGKYDLILDPSHLFLTIHESVGHPTELDRVLGYEANYAGTSFLTLDKWRSKKFNFGNKLVNFLADKTQPNALATIGYDDDGVQCGNWDIIKDGILVNYQTIRDQAHILGLKASQGCSYAQSWSDVPFQRMPNVSLQPGNETVENLIKNTEKGIYMLGRNSYSIDQQRYNFQFSSQLAYEIKNGKIVGMLKDASYQSNTQEFWNSCAAIANKDDYRLGGSFNDGKGQPSQSNAVSHGCATAKFSGINVINTGRNI